MNTEVEKEPLEVIVKDVDIHFGSMVSLMVKAAFASIPALLIVIGVSYGIIRIIGSAA